MARSLRKSSARARKNDLALDRPFDRAILNQAHEIAASYRLILEPNDEVGFMGTSLEMPNVWGDGRTPDHCVRETREALVSVIATMLEKGEAPPVPSAEGRRTEQINIRVTAEEKLLLEEAARNKGFRGISDFVRSTTLANVR
jgi:predicted RNase H-like HicB family nuclease